MEIKQSKNKVKIILEYPKKLMDFGEISRSDLDKLYLKVFLENGKVIFVDEIKYITWAVKKQDEQQNKSFPMRKSTPASLPPMRYP